MLQYIHVGQRVFEEFLEIEEFQQFNGKTRLGVPWAGLWVQGAGLGVLHAGQGCNVGTLLWNRGLTAGLLLPPHLHFPRLPAAALLYDFMGGVLCYYYFFFFKRMTFFSPLSSLNG